MNIDLYKLLLFLNYESDYNCLGKAKQQEANKLVEDNQELYDLAEYTVDNIVLPLRKLDELEKIVNDNNIMLRNICKHLGVSPY